jgi:hypothetical protein
MNGRAPVTVFVVEADTPNIQPATRTVPSLQSTHVLTNTEFYALVICQTFTQSWVRAPEPNTNSKVIVNT